MFRRWVLSVLVTVVVFSGAAEAIAHGGEDHGEAPPSAVTASVKKTGWGAEGSAFQVVLATDHGHSRLYLADMDTNAPVAGANIDIEAGAWKGAARPTQEAGVYDLDWTPAGPTDVTIFVTAGGKEDLILLQANRQTPPSAAKTNDRIRPAILIGAGLAGVLGLVALARKRRGLAAIGLLLALALAAGSAFAHEGHDHGPADARTGMEPGGTVVMPKATQFLLGVRTQRVEPKEAAETVRVLGRVEPDPDGYARVQPSQPARVISDPSFPIPVPGHQVHRGQVLMVLEPTLTNLERSDKRAALYKAESEIAIQARQLAREEALGGVVPAKQVEESRIRLVQLRKERDQLAGTALARETVLAPVDGVVTDVHVVPGEVVGPDKVLIEIVNPQRLRVDAVIHDFSAAEHISSATAATRLIPDMVFPLSLLGVSPRVDPADQGLHAQFAVLGQQVQKLKLGMPVDVYLAADATAMKTAVPREAVTEVGGRQVVFVRTAPETFEARPVRIGRMVGPMAELTDGVKSGDRVVTQGVDQVRASR